MSASTTLPRLVDRLVRAFFREVEVVGTEHVPEDRGGILVAWHPNGLIDPALIVSQFPRRVVFGAREGLFRWPLLGSLLKLLGTVPIRRAADVEGEVDPSARRAANLRALEALANEVARGSFAALFPEGLSHDESRPARLKTGAARLYYLARMRTPPDVPAPVIVPVGLYYDRKHRFRSRAMVKFYPPIALPRALDVTPGPLETEAVAHARNLDLTSLIASALEGSAAATEDWPTHDTIERARKLLHAERGGPRSGTTLRQETEEFATIRKAYYALRTRAPRQVVALRKRINRYDRDLRNLGLEDSDLDGDPRLASRALVWLIIGQALLAFLVLPPVLLIGFVVNGPVALAIRGLARLAGRLRKDQATIKVLAGAVLYPLAWAIAGVIGWRLHARIDEQFRLPDSPLGAGIALALTAMVGGVVALFYLEFARETARSIRVRLTRIQRVRSVTRLRRERNSLAGELRAMSPLAR